MPATVTATATVTETSAQTRVGLPSAASEAMEQLNAEAGGFHIWLRTQANAPSQRPWLKDSGIDIGEALAAGRGGANQMKGRAAPLALARDRTLSRPYRGNCAPPRCIADRVRRSPAVSAHQSAQCSRPILSENGGCTRSKANAARPHAGIWHLDGDGRPDRRETDVSIARRKAAGAWRRHV